MSDLFLVYLTILFLIVSFKPNYLDFVNFLILVFIPFVDISLESDKKGTVYGSVLLLCQLVHHLPLPLEQVFQQFCR